MIITETFFGVKCDRCGLVNEGEYDHEYFADADSALWHAHTSDWAEFDGRHFCPDCYEIAYDGEVVPLESFPTYLRTILTFIDEVIGGYRNNFVRSTDTTYTITFDVYHRYVETTMQNFITAYLNDKLISFFPQDINTSGIRYTIIIKK